MALFDSDLLFFTEPRTYLQRLEDRKDSVHLPVRPPAHLLRVHQRGHRPSQRPCKFGAPMFTPIANNVVLIAVLLAFGTTVHRASLAGVAAHRGQLLLLGLGTTAGGLLPRPGSWSRARAGPGCAGSGGPDLRDEAACTILRPSGWTSGLVVANQIALLVVLALSEKVLGPGAVSAYTYAGHLFELPYGVVAVSIMSVIGPQLTVLGPGRSRGVPAPHGDGAAHHARHRHPRRRRRARPGPAARGLGGRPRRRPQHHRHRRVPGHAGPRAPRLLCLSLCRACPAERAGPALRVLALCLRERRQHRPRRGPGGALRGARHRAVHLHRLHRGRVLSLWLPAHPLPGSRRRRAGRPLGHVLLATGALVLGAVLGSNVSGSESTFVLLARVASGSVVGGAAYVLAGGGLAELARRRRYVARQGESGGPRGPRPGPGSGPPPGTPTVATPGPGGRTAQEPVA